MTVNNSKTFVDERLVPALVPWHQKQMIKDHTERYYFAKKYIHGLVLDAACGSGYGTKILAEKKNVRIYGLDISDQAIQYARTTYKSKKIIFSKTSVMNLPFGDKSVDTVVSFETLEHVTNYKKFISEVGRVLKPEGVFVISTPNILVNGGTANPHHVKELSEIEFVDILQKNFSSVTLFGQKSMQKDYLRFVVWLTKKIPLGFSRWFIDSLLKMIFRGTSVKPISRFQFGFVPAFFVAVCKK
jgi:2-polyprenyl-3-methyl-5-hydroxy-6-metoxy-1,4-benzoquinol methylase